MLTKPFSHEWAEQAQITVSPTTPSTHAAKVIRFLIQRKKHTPQATVSDHASQEKTSSAPIPSLRTGKANASLSQASKQNLLKNQKTNQTRETEHIVFSEQEMQDIPLLAKCISFIMKRGQKAKAARTMNTVLRMLQGLSPQNNKDVHALDIIHTAIQNVKPAFELRKARFGGRTQFIPATLPVHKQENQALRALVQTARTKHQKASYTNKHHDMYTFAYFLAQEIYDAYKHQGAACQAKHGIHKQAEHNRNHVRRRWW